MNKTIAINLSNLMCRLAHCEQLDSELGLNRGRAAEIAGLEWALQTLAQQYPDETAEAELLAEQRITRQRAQGTIGLRK